MAFMSDNRIQFTPAETKAFLAFKRNEEKFIEMYNAGVFKLQSGKVEINIHDGLIANIHIHQMVYKRGVIHSGSLANIMV